MFVVLFFLRIPVGFTMASVGFLGFSYVVGFNAALGMIGTHMWNIFSNYGLTVIPDVHPGRRICSVRRL